MSDTVIRVENLGKKYVIGHKQEKQQYTALRDVIANSAKGFGSRFRRPKDRRHDSTSEEFWALKDVSFEIKQGDRVGIIGRNGAGKSTLLKILSRITEPTRGRIGVKGRVASLLEVGTGFHPELTGRENIFLNGAILGMSKAEIRKKFDEIVAFAEIEKFLDTPVKRYSSGMYVRLAFAVAAHLEPEVLIVDEVLAVGDAQFQKKCIGKMEEVGREGRTVLFVSHNMGAVRALCSTAMYLSNGQIHSFSTVSKVLQDYYEADLKVSNSGYFASDKLNSSTPHFIEVKLKTNEKTSQPDANDPVCIEVTYQSENIKGLVIGLHIYNYEDVEVIHSSSEFSPLKELQDLNIYTQKIKIPSKTLNIGKYRCKLILARRNVAVYDCLENFPFEIADNDFSVALTQANDWKGVLSPKVLQWL